jgi:hypothetical protein
MLRRKGKGVRRELTKEADFNGEERMVRSWMAFLRKSYCSPVMAL